MMSSIRSQATAVDVRQLGTVDYRTAWQLQRDLADARVAGGSDTLLLLEHPAVRAIVVNYRDINGRKQAEAARRASEGRDRKSVV